MLRITLEKAIVSRKLLLLIPLLCGVTVVYAQNKATAPDQIILNVGDTLRARVSRIGVRYIHFTRVNRTSGSFAKKQVAKIIFGDSMTLAIRPEIYTENVDSWESVKVYFDEWAEVAGMKSSGTLTATVKNKTLTRKQLHTRAVRKLREEASLRKQSVIVIYKDTYNKKTGELELVGECFGV